MMADQHRRMLLLGVLVALLPLALYHYDDSFFAVASHEDVHQHARAHRHLSHEHEGGWCSTPDPSAELLQKQADALEHYSEHRRRLNRELVDSVTIPVCFHVVTGPIFGRGQVTDEELQQQLTHLNTAFSSASCCDDSLPWCNPGDCSVDSGFSFGMAVLDENGDIVEGAITGSVSSPSACVTRTSNWWHYNVGFSNLDPGSRYSNMRRALRKGGITTLNVIFKKLNRRDGIGNAVGPFFLDVEGDFDAVVVWNKATTTANAFPQYSEGDAVVHEVGHWLGLVHPWDSALGNPCNGGDFVFDVPSAARGTSGCPTIAPDTCGDGEDDPIHNLMSYSDDVCLYRFSPMQVEIMHASWAVYRAKTVTRSEIPLFNSVPRGPFTLTTFEEQYFAYSQTLENSNVTCKTSFVDPSTGMVCPDGSKCDNGDPAMLAQWNVRPTIATMDAADCNSQTFNENEMCNVAAPLGTGNTLYIFLFARRAVVNMRMTCTEVVPG